MNSTKYQYKVRTQLGFTGVSLYNEQSCLDTISQYCNSAIARRKAKNNAKELNQALDKGREEVLRNIAFFITDQKKTEKPAEIIIKGLADYLNEQYHDILRTK